MIREPAVEGGFYPADKKKLESLLDIYLNFENKNIKVKALVTPHAGFMFSGEVAGKAFAQLKKSFKDIIILCPNHTMYCDFAAVDIRDYKTLFGVIKNSSRKSKSLLKEESFREFPEAHNKEHAVEVVLPFLQKKLKNFKIIPIIIGDIDAKKIAKSLLKILDDKTLLIISTDLSHFHEYDKAVELDKETIKALEELDEEKLKEACGLNALKILIEIAKIKKWKVKILDYKNSGDIILAKSSVVGYMAAMLY